MRARSLVERAAARITSGLLTKHLVASLLATAVDFALMMLLVEALGISAELATLAGALLGGITNFALGRTWVYRAVGARSPAEQAARYAIVSAASAGLNALGEHVVLAWAGAHYAAARALVSLVVSVGWGYPMQRYMVFARPAPAPTPTPAVAAAVDREAA
jgi:putative flippase GtrA